jgi:hypothetical protein
MFAWLVNTLWSNNQKNPIKSPSDAVSSQTVEHNDKYDDLV